MNYDRDIIIENLFNSSTHFISSKNVFVEIMIGTSRWIKVGCRKLIELVHDIVKVLSNSLTWHVVMRIELVGLSAHVVNVQIDIINI